MTANVITLPLFLGHEHPCGYLSDQMARMAFVSPTQHLDPAVFSALISQGFRRSGDLVYRPQCPDCQGCIPVRIAATRFRPNRSQRRNQRRNEGLTVIECPPVFSEEHFSLYLRYLDARHPGGDMAESSPEDYMRFVSHAPSDVTRFFEFREAGGELLALSVIDRMVDGFSAVYTFYDPDQPARGLGVFAILWQIEEVKRRKLSWVYLGFWVQASGKMSYKSNYDALEQLSLSGWIPHKTEC